MLIAIGIPKVIEGNGMKIAFAKIIGKFVSRINLVIGWEVLV